MSRAGDTPAVDVAIVNWNTSEAALAAARAYLDSEGVSPTVTIVDNGSDKEERRLLERERPESVRVDLVGANLGYGSAANRALRGGDGEIVCISNADLAPEPSALAVLANTAITEPRAGMVGPVFGSSTDGYHSRLPGPGLLLGRIFVGSFGRSAVENLSAGSVAVVDQPSGACLVLQRTVWEEVGGFDEGFFLWYEDVDLARRLIDAGYRNLVAGSARVRHQGARSFAQIEPRKQQAIRLRSLERYLSKHHQALLPVARPLLWLAARIRAR